MFAPRTIGQATLLIALTALPLAAQTAVAINPDTLPAVTTIDKRFQSYNIEMLEVTGGRFWKPYADTTKSAPAPTADATPAGMSADMYAYRAPKDLSSPRLRKLAAALGPAYVRVSGTWANTTYFPAPGETLTAPPTGFGGVLTRPQWKGVIDFAHATNAEIVTSFSTGVGTRDASGQWRPVQAQRLLDYTASLHGNIAAAEYMNEPTFAALGGAPKGYDAAQYGRDFATFLAFIRANAPALKVAGPGSVGESAGTGINAGIGGSMPGFIATPKLLAAMGKDSVDIFSYHMYGGVSQRCKSMAAANQATPEAALSENWLATTDDVLAYYKQQRDQYDPGKPIWLTETGETACGGNPWAATFLDSFRYLDQLGRLAKSGVQVTMHNTLAASDYALLDENTYAPRPNFWAALLWRRFMGTTVLDAAIPLQPGLHVYAHCENRQTGGSAHAGGVTLLVIQNDPAAPHTLNLSTASDRYTLSAASAQLAALQTQSITLNSTPLTLGPNDTLPKLTPVATPAGVVTFAPATITFLTLPKADNPACR
jgi:hypothetical protein